MNKLYKLLKDYSIEDALNIEKNDLQYKSLEKLYENIQNKELFLSLILANSIVCYQLSSTWENYWEEFSNYFSFVIPVKTGIYRKEKQKYAIKDTNILNNIYSKGNSISLGEFIDSWSSQEWHKKIIKELSIFLPNSKWNKRFVETKINRLKKLEPFLGKFDKNKDFYMENLIVLRDELAETMWQKKDAKTIVFAIKMILYWYTIVNNWKSTLCPFEIEIPIDSRLTKIFDKYKEKHTNIKVFYSELSKKLQIPEIHLDAIIWVNFEELMK